MKKSRIGYALLLLGIIFAAPGETMFWWTAVILGIIGFILVCMSKE